MESQYKHLLYPENVSYKYRYNYNVKTLIRSIFNFEQSRQNKGKTFFECKKYETKFETWKLVSLQANGWLDFTQLEPNSFFRPAKLNRFSNQINCFIVWKHCNLFTLCLLYWLFLWFQWLTDKPGNTKRTGNHRLWMSTC